ncbi:MAG: NUDIX domain-containing protein [Bacteroidota bacterium]
MYVIYVNDRPLTLLPKTSPGTRGLALDEGFQAEKLPTHLTARYNGKPRTLLNYVDMLEKGSPKVTSVDLVVEDVEQAWADFRGYYKWVPAAGGLVRNTDLDRYLFIFRRGSWDLPKGKIDAGEDAPTAALREVTEETGIADLRLGSPLPITYHTYRNRKGKRVLKPTYWFAMETTTTELQPQAEEDIERAEWLAVSEVLWDAGPLYASLRAFLEQVLPG